MSGMILPTAAPDARSIRLLLEANPRVGARKVGPRRFWTVREEKIVRETYPGGGVLGCLPLLPGRSAATIYQKAAKLGVRHLNAAGKPQQRQTYRFTPAIDEAIRRVYQGEPNFGAVKHLAATLGWPRSVVSGRAQHLGLVVPRFREAPWCDAEFAILEANWTLHPGTIRRKLLAAGFRRSNTAILIKRKRFGSRAANDHTDSEISGPEVVAAFGVTRDTVARWIDKGWLRARRVKSHAAPEFAEPHDRAHLRIKRADLRAFVVENVGIVDFRKVDKFWLVDLLTDPQIGRHGRG